MSKFKLVVNPIYVKRCRTYSGFRREIARILSLLQKQSVLDASLPTVRAIKLLRDTGYEAGEFLEGIWNAYCEHELSLNDKLSPSECMLAAWSTIHDAIVSLPSASRLTLQACDTLFNASDLFCDKE